jgi:hypothetical protein
LLVWVRLLPRLLVRVWLAAWLLPACRQVFRFQLAGADSTFRYWFSTFRTKFTHFQFSFYPVVLQST